MDFYGGQNRVEPYIKEVPLIVPQPRRKMFSIKLSFIWHIPDYGSSYALEIREKWCENFWNKL